jgi:bifunctional non-homologous end joining protein LigD
VPVYLPMLVTPGAPRRFDAEEWAAEPKLDGWRSIVTINDRVEVRSRTGRFITSRVPELDPLRHIGLPVVLDGELVALDDRGHVDFYALSQRMLGRRLHRAVTFCAFDVLWLDGHDCTVLPYEHRRRLLESLELTGPTWCTLPSVPADSANDLLDACARFGQEGIVLKRLGSQYVPGARSQDWRKQKTVEWRTVEGPRRLPAEVRAAMDARE